MQQVTSDIALLQEYRRTGSHDAFRALVQQHVDFVYATARRLLRDAHLVEDVTQAVFILLSQKAQRIPTDRPLAGWLYKATTYTAANARRAELTRQHHERRAAAMNASRIDHHTSQTWQSLRPILDEGLSRLRPRDRDAILLRYFQQRTLREVADAMNLSEDAAAKRVARATERLRDHFHRRGVTVTSATLVATLTAHTAEAAPAGLAATAASIAVAPVAGTVSATLAKGALIVMATEKVKSGIVAGVILLLALGGGTVAVKTLLTSDAPPRRMVEIVEPPPPLPLPGQPLEGAIRFNNGTVVSILGINDTADAATWWMPDGSATVAFDVPERSRVHIGNYPNMRQIRIRMMAQPSMDAAVTFMMNPAGVASGISSNLHNGNRIYDYSVAIPSDRTTADLVIRSARGPWEVDVTYNIEPGQHPSDAPPGLKVIEKVHEENGETVVRVREHMRPPTDVHEQFLLMTEQGEVAGGSMTGWQDYSEHRFRVPLSDVKAARYRSRPWQLIEVRNVSLRNGFATQPEVVPASP